jgi:hypothetical protein
LRYVSSVLDWVLGCDRRRENRCGGRRNGGNID